MAEIMPGVYRVMGLTEHSFLERMEMMGFTASEAAEGGRGVNGPCQFPCMNKTEFGYCKTTVCLYAPTIRVTSMPQQNAGETAQAKTDTDRSK